MNAWNQGWNALEGDNEVDLSASVLMTKLVTTSHGTIVTEASNIITAADGETATYTNGLGISVEIQASAVQMSTTYSVSLRDSRADEVEVQYGSGAGSTQFFIGNVEGTGGQVLAVRGSDSWDTLVDKIEGGIQNAYDNGFEDGYSAGYDDGFAAAKGVVKN